MAIRKDEALRLFGGTPSSTARALNIRPQAVSAWPVELPPKIEDRVLAALVRRHIGARRLVMFARTGQKVSALR